MSSRSSTTSTPRTRRSRRYAAALGTVIAASLLWALSPSAALAVSDPSGTASTTAPPPPSTSRVANPYDPTGYWTLERMAKATPVTAPTTSSSTAQQRVGDGSSGITPPAAPTVANTERVAAPVPSTVGKVFFRSAADGKDHVCTAATINTAKKNLVETAAHCVYSVNKGWNSNILFSPKYYNGPSSYGTYSWSTARTFTTYMSTGNSNYDQAFVAFYPRNGVQLVNAVGGNGFMYGVSTVQTGVRIWGYPVEGKYAGYTTPLYCDGSTRTGSNPRDAMMTCDMTGGASGGPWLKNRISVDLGYVMAATSRRTLSGTPSLLAIPNNSSTKAMLDQMG